MYCLQSLCSICLNNNSDHLINLNSKSTDDILLIEKLEFCIPGTHHQNSNSYFICPKCVQKLNISYEFITLCKTNRTKYENYIFQLSDDAVYKKQHNMIISLLDIKKIGLLDRLYIENETVENAVEDTTVVEIKNQPELPEKLDHDYCVTERKIEIKKPVSPEIKNDNNILTDIKQEVMEYEVAKSQCPACKMHFENRQQFIVHFKVRIFQINRVIFKKYKCCTCFKSFMNRKELYDHILTHPEYPVPAVMIKRNNEVIRKGNFKCNICAQQFRLKNLFEKHVQSHKMYACKACPRKFFSRQKLNEHLKLHLSKKYICKLSDDKFQNKIIIKSVVTGKYDCRICNKSFETLRGVKIHERFHDTYCKICNKKCKSRLQLRKHRLKHIRDPELEQKCTELINVKTDNCPIPQGTNFNPTFYSNDQKESTENPKIEQVNANDINVTKQINVYESKSKIIELNIPETIQKLTIEIQNKQETNSQKENGLNVSETTQRNFQDTAGKSEKSMINGLNLNKAESTVPTFKNTAETNKTSSINGLNLNQIETTKPTFKDTAEKYKTSSVNGLNLNKTKTTGPTFKDTAEKNKRSSISGLNLNKTESKEPTFKDTAEKNKTSCINGLNLNKTETTEPTFKDTAEKNKTRPINALKLNSNEIKLDQTCQTSSLDKNVPSISQNKFKAANPTAEPKILQCKFCKQMFNDKINIVAHYSSIKTNELNICSKIYTCCICKAIFNLKTYWQNHMTDHLKNVYSCARCPNKYIRKAAYEEHVVLHEKQKYLCMVCYYKFDSEKELKDHFKFRHYT